MAARMFGCSGRPSSAGRWRQRNLFSSGPPSSKLAWSAIPRAVGIWRKTPPAGDELTRGTTQLPRRSLPSPRECGARRHPLRSECGRRLPIEKRREQVRCKPCYIGQMVPPPWLEWTAIVVAFAALALAVAALPTVLQMWFGKPSISVEFEKVGISLGVALKCNIINNPVKSRLLKRIGVRRQEARDLGGRVTIRESGGKKYVESMRLVFSYLKDEGEMRINLHPGNPTFVLIAYHKWKDGKPMLSSNGEDGNDNLELEPGEYDCELSLEWGQDRFETTRTFLISSDHHKTGWRIPKST